MKQSRKIDIRYIAGFFDGEGCITFSKIQKYNPTMKRRYPCTTIRMEASNTDFNIIKDIHNYFKIGHVINLKPRKKGYKNYFVSMKNLCLEKDRRERYK